MISHKRAKSLRRRLEDLYARYNRRRWVYPDPVEFLYHYEDPEDREIVGLIASSLAYGRVRQIRRSISFVLEKMPSPKRFLRKASRRDLSRKLEGFKHRFTTAQEIELLLFEKLTVGQCLDEFVVVCAPQLVGERLEPFEHRERLLAAPVAGNVEGRTCHRAPHDGAW